MEARNARKKTNTHRLVLQCSLPGTSGTLTDSCAHSGSGLLTDSTAPKRSRPHSPPGCCQDSLSTTFIKSDVPQGHFGLLTRAVQQQLPNHDRQGVVYANF